MIWFYIRINTKSSVIHQCNSLGSNIQDNLISNYILLLSKSKILLSDVSFASFLPILNIGILYSKLLSAFIFPIKTYVPSWNNLGVFSLSRTCKVGVFFWDKKSVEFSWIAMRWDTGQWLVFRLSKHKILAKTARALTCERLLPDTHCKVLSPINQTSPSITFNQGFRLGSRPGINYMSL